MNEKGFASLLGLCLLSLMLFFALGIASLNQNEKLIVDNFISGLQAENLAASGAEKAILQLRRDASPLAKAREAKPLDAAICLWENDTAGVPIRKCTVYLTYDQGKYILMSISQMDAVKGQVFVYLQPTETGFSVEKWER
jgi:hypothetical protein